MKLRLKDANMTIVLYNIYLIIDILQLFLLYKSWIS